jgi:hypothetical protein
MAAVGGEVDSAAPAAKPAQSPTPDNPFADAEPTDNKGAQAKPVEKPTSKKKAQATFGDGPLCAGEQAILKTLDEPTTLEFTEKPLSALAEHIRQKHHIPVVFDKKAMADVAIGLDTPITASISQVSLSDALDLILHEVGLTWTIKSGVLLITTQEEAESHLIVKCYDVADLVAVVPDRPYRGDSLQSTAKLSANDLTTLPPVAGFVGMGGMSEGALGRMRMLPTTMANAADVESVIDMIASTIKPTTWDAVGGQGSIAPFQDHFLIANQTLQVHREIESLFAEIRAKREIGGTLVVELHWLWLDAAQHEQLVGNAKPTADGHAPWLVNAKALAQLAGKVPGFRGQIACTNGQLVHLASGDRQSVITSAIPVIGSGVGYQPVIERPNVGVVIELRPSAVPGADAVILDVQSTVTRWSKPRPSVRIGASWPPYQVTEGATKDGPHETTAQPGGEASAPVDRPVMPAQRLATTVRVPLGKPVVLGAMTFSPTGAAGLAKAGENPTQLYLIATTSIAQPAAKPEPKKPY